MYSTLHRLLIPSPRFHLTTWLCLLLFVSIAGNSVAQIQDKAIVWTQKTELRETPNMRGKVTTMLYQGERLTYLGEKSQNIMTYNLLEGKFSAPWYKVETSNGTSGYVWGGGVKFLDQTEKEPNISALLDLQWDQQAWNMGAVKSPKAMEQTFTFTNTGKSTYTIAGAKPSCGCLKTTWSKEPVGPGETGWVKINFSSYGRAGHEVHKYVTVLWKEGGVSRVIRVNGVVH